MISGAYSLPQILEKLNDEMGFRIPFHKRLGGKPMARSKIYQIFTDEFYFGKFEYPVKSGIWHKGKHEPMISEQEFWRVQVMLGNKASQRPKRIAINMLGLCGAVAVRRVLHANRNFN